MRIAACLLTAVHAQDLFLEHKQAKDAEVIIIGAGWAGMGAAHHLHTNGVENILVLEGGDRVGGRTRSIEFGSESVGKYIFEQGSNWVCGSGNEDKPHAKNVPKVYENPVKKLMEEAKLEVAYIPGATDGNMSNYYKVYDEFGVDTDESGDLRKKANDALACLNTKAPDANNKESVRQGLKDCGWNPSTNAEWAMDWAVASDESGVLAKNSALAGFAPDPTYDWWGPDDYLVVDQDPRGFARLIDHMVQDSVPVDDERVKLNSKVTRIEWGGDGATITTEDGRTFSSDHVISTMSKGVLERHHQDLFHPGLPSKQADVLVNDHQPMANLTHVLVQFPSVWWDDSIPAWISANDGGKDQRGKFTVWHNLNADGFVPGSKTLLSFLGEPEASIYGNMTEAEIMPVIMERLRAQNPNIDIPDPSAAWIKNWGFDPLFYGAYVYDEVGVEWSAKWKKPLKADKKSIVQFAGEATCDQLDGYTHGALQSGIEAAAIYLHEYHSGPNPEKHDELNLCNFYYY